MLRRGTSLFDTWNNDNGLIAAALTDGGAFARLAVEDQSEAYTLAGTSSKNLTIASVFSTALPIDGVGDLHPITTPALFVVTPDEAGDGKGLAPGNPVLTVDAAAHTIGTLNTIGD